LRFSIATRYRGLQTEEGAKPAMTDLREEAAE